MDSDGVAIAGKRLAPSARLGWLFGLIAIGALVAGVLHFGDLERFAALARRARPLWLGAAILLQGSTYGAVALGWALVLRRARHPVAFRSLDLVGHRRGIPSVARIGKRAAGSGAHAKASPRRT